MNQKVPKPRELQVPNHIHKLNRQRLLTQIKVDQAILLLPGVTSLPIDDSDIDYAVQQEKESDCYGVMELDTGKATVFIPRLEEDYKLWMYVPTQDELKNKCGLDEVRYVDELEEYLKQKQPSAIYLYDGVNTDSKLRPKIPSFEFLSKYNVNKTDLYNALDEARVIKNEEEIKVLRHICKISSEAHEKILRKIGVGNKEYQMEALMKYHCLSTCGARFEPYNCICASGRNASTLHYIVNDKLIKDDTLILSDMGGKYYGYCSDITVTFPSNGKFNEKQKVIYNAVLDANLQVYKSIKAGVNWGDMHMLAERVITQHLQKAGIIVGELEELYKNRIGQLFFPHGLGHLLGLRTHDVGGYNKGCPPRSPEMKTLRFRRNMEVGMVFTNEPGCYFIEFMLQKALNNPEKAKFLNKEKIDEYMEVGGVRIEDDLVLTENGPEIMNDVPRTIEEVEACMRGEEWRNVSKK